MTKKNNLKKVINEKTKKQIHKLADMGVTDEKICQITGASRHFVQKETTLFWKLKMQFRKEDD